jgi:chromosomal replication initiator protein
MRVRLHIDPELFQKRRLAELTQGDAFLSSAADSQQPPKPNSRTTDPAAGSVSTRTKEESASHPPLLTLETFVVGDCNRMAHAAALEVVARPGKAFNPLFVHGGCGLGKTHLLQGIVHAVAARHRTPRVLYITAEQFTNRYIMAVRTRSLDAFRHRFRTLDVLAIDDIHFLAGKEATQEEFLHTFNAFDLASRQVVMASDCHPKMLQSIQDTLINRFVSGMVAHVAPPDRRTRIEILSRKAVAMGTCLSEGVLEQVAGCVTGSVRELEGALIRVMALASLEKCPVTPELAREALADHVAAGQASLSVDAILDAVAAYFSVARSDIVGRKRTRTITLPRQMAMYLSRRLTAMSFPEIGRLLGGKNHTTVLAACRRVDEMLERNEQAEWHQAGALRRMKVDDLLGAIEDRLRR